MTSNKSPSILSIDYGERYFGFAVKLKNETTIFSLSVVDIKKSNLFDNLDSHIKEYDPSVIIIGYPIGLSGNKSRMTNEVDKFIKLIKQRYKIDIIRVDERFTSKINTVKGKERNDNVSALNILETFIYNEQISWTNIKN